MKTTNFSIFSWAAVIVVVMVYLCLYLLPEPRSSAPKEPTYSTSDMEHSYHQGFVNAYNGKSYNLKYNEEKDCFSWVHSPWSDGSTPEYDGCEGK